MSRLLPPLVLLAVLGVVVARCAMEPARAAGRARIDGLVEGGRFVEAQARLVEYLEQYREPQDNWYAAQTFFRARRPDLGVAQIFDDPRLARDPGTARRFAQMALFTMGWSDAQRSEPTLLEPSALLTLVEGGSAWARERLSEHGRTLPLVAATLYFIESYRLRTRAPMDVLMEAFRARNEEHFQVAAALGTLGAEPYPERESDIRLLIQVLESAEWRRQYPDVWYVSALSLGRSGEANAREALLRTEARLEGATAERERIGLQMTRVGLLAAGEWRTDAALAANALSPSPQQQVLAWYLEALIHRYRMGDRRTEQRLVQLWEGPGRRSREIRGRLARAYLLQDRLPSEEAVKTWVGRMLDELEGPDAGLMAHALARAYRLRIGVPGAREALVEVLRAAGPDLGSSAPTDGETRAYVEALRALYLYG